jgi:hypothetical protein
MRTTITLDADVMAKLRSKVRRSGRSFKDVVNDALRTGLAADAKHRQLAPFVVEEQHLVRLKPGRNYDKVEDVFDMLDGPGRTR